jgi:dihydrofolate reductase
MMRKVIAAINMTIDGFCDHTAGVPDTEVHDHYSKLLNEAGVLLYGRTTFELMKYWQELLKNPSGEKAMDDFANAIDKIPKIVFSHTMKDTGWDTASISNITLEQKVKELKQSKESGAKDILIGSPALIAQLTNLNLIDEYQLCVHPVILGSGLTLFKNLSESLTLKPVKTKTFGGGAILLCYEPAKR